MVRGVGIGSAEDRPEEVEEDRETADVAAPASQVRTGLWLVLFLAAAAVALRAVPISISPLPYNSDGLTETRMAADILASGHLEYPAGASYVAQHGVDTPLFNILLAGLSAVSGWTPLALSPWLMAALGSFIVVGTFALAEHLTGSRRAAIIAALFVLLFGPAVAVTGQVWKTAFGFALLPMLFYAWGRRNVLSLRLFALLLLALLPFLHHFVAVSAYSVVTLATAYAIFVRLGKPRVSRAFVVDLLTVAALWALLLLYYAWVRFDRLDLLAQGTDEYLLAALLVVVAGAMIVVLHYRAKPGPQWGIVLLFLLGGFILLNIYQPLFAVETSARLRAALLIVPGLVWIIPVWMGFELFIFSESPGRILLTALLFGPSVVIAFAFLRGWDAVSFQILYRGFDYFMPIAALGAGAGLAYFLARTSRPRLLATVLVLCLVATTPLAFQQREFFHVRLDTQEYEVDGLDWLVDHSPQSFQLLADWPLSSAANRLFDIPSEASLPRRLAESLAIPQGSMLASELSWTTTGTDDFPAGVVRLDPAEFNATLAAGTVLYRGGPVSQQLVLWTSA